MKTTNVMPFAVPESSTGTIVWASLKVMQLLDDDGEIRDASERHAIVRKLVSFCEGGF